MITISDSTGLILLSRIGRIELLRDVFEAVVITPEVVDEVVNDVHARSGAAEVRSADWIQVVSPRDRDRFQTLLMSRGAGESSVIALAEEHARDDVLVILDDGPARATARRIGLHLIGTAGVLVLAKRRGLIPEIAPVLEQLLQADMRLGRLEVEAVLAMADELPPTPHP